MGRGRKKPLVERTVPIRLVSADRRWRCVFLAHPDFVPLRGPFGTVVRTTSPSGSIGRNSNCPGEMGPSMGAMVWKGRPNSAYNGDPRARTTCMQRWIQWFAGKGKERSGTTCHEGSKPSKAQRKICHAVDPAKGRQVRQSHSPCSSRCNDPMNHKDVTNVDTPLEAGLVAKRNLRSCHIVLQHLPFTHKCTNWRPKF